jgi:hypothetical protein
MLLMLLLLYYYIILLFINVINVINRVGRWLTVSNKVVLNTPNTLWRPLQSMRFLEYSTKYMAFG